MDVSAYFPKSLSRRTQEYLTFVYLRGVVVGRRKYPRGRLRGGMRLLFPEPLKWPRVVDSGLESIKDFPLRHTDYTTLT